MKKLALTLALLAFGPPAAAQDETETFDAWFAKFNANYAGEGKHVCWVSTRDTDGVVFQLVHLPQLDGPDYEIAPQVIMLVPTRANPLRLERVWISASIPGANLNPAMTLRGEHESAESGVGGSVRIEDSTEGALGVLNYEDRGRVAGWLQLADELAVRVGDETASEIRVPLADYRRAAQWCRNLLN